MGARRQSSKRLRPILADLPVYVTQSVGGGVVLPNSNALLQESCWTAGHYGREVDHAVEEGDQTEVSCPSLNPGEKLGFVRQVDLHGSGVGPVGQCAADIEGESLQYLRRFSHLPGRPSCLAPPGRYVAGPASAEKNTAW